MSAPALTSSPKTWPGLTSERIADALSISYSTVHFHRTKIRRKLGFHTEHEMNRFAILVLQADALYERPMPASGSASPIRTAL